MQTRSRFHWPTCLALCALALAGSVGCDNGKGYTIGGTVTGLIGSNLVLTTPGQADLTLTAGQTTFAFASKVESGTAYDVKVGLEPTTGTCTVAQGTGVVNGADVAVAVTCSGTSAWTQTGSMVQPRGLSAVTQTLASGKVLIAGGHTSTTLPGWYSKIIANAELFDPASGTWTQTGTMTSPRRGACSVRLPSGEALVVGGQYQDVGDLGAVTEKTAELYDPASGAWARTAGDLSVARAFATCTLLDSGKVLVAGGVDLMSPRDITATAELFAPMSGTFTVTGSMAVYRWFHTATKLSSGKVLVVGGGCAFDTCNATASAELYDPDTGLWSPAGALPVGVGSHTATLLPTGEVLVVGGCHQSDLVALTCTERGASLYDPGTGLWSVTGSMAVGRGGHAALQLDSGDVLVVGGNGQTTQTSTERYHPASGTWEPGPSTFAPHSYARVARLPDGRWLVAGGADITMVPHYAIFSATEIFEE